MSRQPLPKDEVEHYKGGRYVVEGIAQDENTGETLVVYRSLADGRLWVRPLRVWMSWAVSSATGEPVERYRTVGKLGKVTM